MSIDFQAFTSTIVLDTFQKKIEALDCWNGKVMAGLADGTLVVLEPNAEDAGRPWQVAQALKAFSKKHAVQMQVTTKPSLVLIMLTVLPKSRPAGLWVYALAVAEYFLWIVQNGDERREML